MDTIYINPETIEQVIVFWMILGTWVIVMTDSKEPITDPIKRVLFILLIGPIGWIALVCGAATNDRYSFKRAVLPLILLVLVGLVMIIIESH